VTFEISNAEQQLTTDASLHFDLIHARAITGCFKDPEAVSQRAFDALLPGRYLELHDMALPYIDIVPMAENSMFKRFMQELQQSMLRREVDLTRTKKYATWLEELGFEEVVERRYYWPIGTWAEGETYKRIGEMFLRDLFEAVKMAAPMFPGAKGQTPEQVAKSVKDIEEELFGGGIVSYLEV
jgi:hypothetical protein